MMRFIRLFTLVTALALLAGPAVAAVTAVNATPGSANVALVQGASVAVNWRVTTNSAGSVSVVSAQGRFRAPSGSLLATVASPLSRTVTGSATASFFESVLVPPDVLTRAQREGHDHIFYERIFSDGIAASGQVTLRIVTANVANFGISQMVLAFDDHAGLRIVSGGAKLTAKAQVVFTGNGLLQGVWEVAGPNAAGVKPEWRTLSQVVQILSGTDSTVLMSPALPTRAGGVYRIRLRIEAPAVAFEVQTLRYQVDASRGTP